MLVSRHGRATAHAAAGKHCLSHGGAMLARRAVAAPRDGHGFVLLLVSESGPIW